MNMKNIVNDCGAKKKKRNKTSINGEYLTINHNILTSIFSSASKQKRNEEN